MTIINGVDNLDGKSTVNTGNPGSTNKPSKDVAPGTTVINFDTDANGNPLTSPGLFEDTTALTDLYAPLGVNFSGAAINDGGAILDQNGGFGVNARSGTQFFAFNSEATLSDGGIPQSPETISFDSPISDFSIFASGGDVATTFQLEAFDSSNNSLGTQSVATNQGEYQELSFSSGVDNIAKVVLSETGGDKTFVFDDLTIKSDPVEISIDNVSVNEGQNGTTQASLVVTLDQAATGAVTVDYATADDTALAASDYVAGSGTLTFEAGETSKTISVDVNGDTQVELDENFFVNLTNATNANVAVAQGSVTIVNDDVPNISINDVSLTEGNSGTKLANFVISLDQAGNDPVSVNYATGNSSAIAGSDYNATNGSVTFAVGETLKTVSVAVRGDTAIEGNETFFVNLTSPVKANIIDNQGVGTIVNDDFSLSKVSISDRALAEGNSGITNALFVISLDKASSQGITASYATSGSTAASGIDFVAASGTVSFNPGQTSRTISVGVIGETVYELNENFSVNITNVTNAGVADSQGLATIFNDDTLPKVSVSDSTLTEGNGGVTNTNFVLKLDKASSQFTSIQYYTGNGTATSGSDYIASTGVVTFGPNQTIKTVTVGVIGDNVYEPNENFSLNLTGPTNAGIADSKGIATIFNDDPLPKISIADRSVNEGNSGTTNANFVVTLDRASSINTTVSYATSNSTASAPSDYFGLTGSLIFSPGQTSKTISIAVRGDTTKENNENFLVNLTSPVNASFADSQAIGTIVNDDFQSFSSKSSDNLIGQVKTLTGTSSSDVYKLDGNYASHQNADYALIVGFESGKDTIQLQGSASDYYLGSAQGLPNGLGIFLKEQNELVGIVKDVTNLNLQTNSFSFVA